MSLDGAQYTRAAMGLNATLLTGMADRSGFKIHQQQGAWATARDRRQFAFRRQIRAGVCRADALIAAAPAIARALPTRNQYTPVSNLGAFERARLDAALDWIDPERYKSWIDTAHWLKAAWGESAYPQWLAWSERASPAARQMNDDAYLPAAIWQGLSPRIDAARGAGAVFGHARDCAIDTIRQASKDKEWDERARNALIYLRRFHPHAYTRLALGAE
jgi:hypothetical protein